MDNQDPQDNLDPQTEGCCISREMTIEEMCSEQRQRIELLKKSACFILNNHQLNCEDLELEGANIPKSRNENIKANLTLVFRSLEDARMRYGKAMQAYQGGISIFDKPEKERLGV